MTSIQKLGAVGVLLAIVLGYAFLAQATGTYTLGAVRAQTAAIVTVGPDTNVQVLASSSRSYALIQRDGSQAAVYCNGNGDAGASTTATGGTSFKLSTSTGESYEYHLEKNPYSGAIRCTATASTSVIVYELRIR